MLCGFCGTNINPGFNTCTGCGATYKKVSGCFGNLISAFAVMLFFFGFMVIIFSLGIKAFAAGLWIGIPLIVASVGIICLAAKKAQYQWVRPARRNLN